MFIFKKYIPIGKLEILIWDWLAISSTFWPFTLNTETFSIVWLVLIFTTSIAGLGYNFIEFLLKETAATLNVETYSWAPKSIVELKILLLPDKSKSPNKAVF